MENKTNKPRLVFFQWKHDRSPRFLQLHMQLHIKCLSEFFDVILINWDCDYQKVCDAYQPDLTLFESGYKTSFSRKITIANTSAHPQIPKLGLHNGDSWCDCRPGFISDMANWGIDTFFSICTTTAEHTPELAENLFVWPNFIDSEIYRDYGQSKIIPVLFNGSMISLYPWRQKIYKMVSSCYPSLIFPHLGYESHSPVMIHGEQYARTINASWFVPACGTVAKEVIRKHFEIPGSKSCLITEKTPSMEAAGFVDMQNCVFADERDVLDKLEYLFGNTHELEKIIDRGYQLVQSRHTLKNRDEIFQWFTLYKDLKPDEKIVQVSPFKGLRIVKKKSDIKNVHISCGGLHLVLLHQGDEKLWSGKYNEAEALYLKCLNYISSMSEPKLKLTICNLFKGNTGDALQWLIQPLEYNLGIYRALDPDPVEWAYLIITLLCQGKYNEAVIRANQFPALHHPELEWIRWVINFLQNKDDKRPLPHNSCLKPRYTIHQLPQLSFIDWINNLSLMLEACQQLNYAEILRKQVTLKEKISQHSIKNSDKFLMIDRWLLAIRIGFIEKINYIFEGLHIPVGRRGLPSIFIIDYIFRLCRWVRIDVVIRLLRKHPFYLKGYFKTGEDELRQVLQILLEKEDVKTLLIISPSVDAAEALFTKKQEKCDELAIFYIKVITAQPTRLNNTYSTSSRYYELQFSSVESFSTALNNCIKQVKQTHTVSFFDMVLIDSVGVTKSIEWNELYGANFIVINNISTAANYENKQKLLSDPHYTMILHNPLHNEGYAIFKKLNCNPFPEKFSPLEKQKQEPSFN